MNRDLDFAVETYISGLSIERAAAACGVGRGSLQRELVRRGVPRRNTRPPGPWQERFWRFVEKGDGCWEWRGGRSNYGHGMFAHPDRRTSAHRIAYELLVGPVPEGLVLDHLCRNPGCVNPEHVEPVTQGENIRRGCRTKLTPDDVRAIRAVPAGVTARVIAEDYVVSRWTIINIRARQIWKDVV